MGCTSTGPMDGKEDASGPKEAPEDSEDASVGAPMAASCWEEPELLAESSGRGERMGKEVWVGGMWPL